MTSSNTDRGLPKATLLLETCDVSARILALGQHGMHIAVPGHVRVGRVVRLSLRGAYAQAIVLTRVVGVVRGERALGLKLQYRAVSASGHRDRALQFVRHDLRLRDAPESGLVRRQQSWFYQFAARTPQTDVMRPDSGMTRRREERVSLRIPVDFTYVGDGYLDVGVAYNGSARGIFVMTDAPLPESGREVEVIVPLPGSSTTGYAVLTGHVRWAVPAMDGPGGGFGLELTHIDDGCDGLHWSGLLRQEREFGSAMEVEWDGDISQVPGTHPARPGLRRRPGKGDRRARTGG